MPGGIYLKHFALGPYDPAAQTTTSVLTLVHHYTEVFEVLCMLELPLSSYDRVGSA